MTGPEQSLPDGLAVRNQSFRNLVQDTLVSMTRRHLASLRRASQGEALSAPGCQPVERSPPKIVELSLV